MSPQMQADVIAALEANRQDLVAAAADLTDEQAITKPAPNRWSVLDCVEHVVVVENRFLGWIETGTPIEAKHDPARDAELKEFLADRSVPRDAPEGVHPTGRFATLAQALEQFHQVRDRSIRMAEERGQALLTIGAQHPRFGHLNGNQVLNMVAGHAGRHTVQIREARAILGF